MKRFRPSGLTRDKDYELVKGLPEVRVAWFTANPNGEAETVKFLHAGYLVVSVAVEHDYIIERRAVGHELVLFESCAHEALLAVDVEFLVGFCHGACLDSGKASYGRMPPWTPPAT